MAMRPRNAKQATPATSGRKIKIKPFSNPPSLPPEFYSRTSSVLLAATQAILRQKPLYAASPPSIEIIGADTATDESKHCNSILSTQPTADNDITRASGAQSPTSALSSPSTVISGSSSLRVRVISREELYKSVESLCVHKFGAHLYQEITKAIDDAALESLARLCADGSAMEVKGEDGKYLYFMKKFTDHLKMLFLSLFEFFVFLLWNLQERCLQLPIQLCQLLLPLRRFFQRFTTCIQDTQSTYSLYVQSFFTLIEALSCSIL